MGVSERMSRVRYVSINASPTGPVTLLFHHTVYESLYRCPEYSPRVGFVVV